MVESEDDKKNVNENKTIHQIDNNKVNTPNHLNNKNLTKKVIYKSNSTDNKRILWQTDSESKNNTNTDDSIHNKEPINIKQSDPSLSDIDDIDDNNNNNNNDNTDLVNDGPPTKKRRTDTNNIIEDVEIIICNVFM